MGKIRYRMLQAYVTLVRGITCFKTCKTLGYMEIIVFKSPPGGTEEAKPYLSHNLIAQNITRYVHASNEDRED